VELSKKAKSQRIKHHFATSDVWNFCDTNAAAQIHALTELKEMAHGHPVYGGIETMDDWYAALDKMIDGWQAVLDLENWKFVPGEYGKVRDACEQRFHEGMELYVKFYWSLWD